MTILARGKAALAYLIRGVPRDFFAERPEVLAQVPPPVADARYLSQSQFDDAPPEIQAACSFWRFAGDGERWFRLPGIAAVAPTPAITADVEIDGDLSPARRAAVAAALRRAADRIAECDEFGDTGPDADDDGEEFDDD